MISMSLVTVVVTEGMTMDVSVVTVSTTLDVTSDAVLTAFFSSSMQPADTPTDISDTANEPEAALAATSVDVAAIQNRPPFGDTV
jgi:hypothetical protein